MAVMLEYYRRLPKSNWTIPGCVRYKATLELPKAIRLACPESRAIFDRAASLLNDGLKLKDHWMAPVSPADDIFCFRSDRKALLDRDEKEWVTTTKLFLTRPQVRPAQIAIEILYDDIGRIGNFGVDGSGNIENYLPSWFKKTVEWARDAREESSTGLRVSMKPPQESLAIDVQDLHTVFVLSYGITVLNTQVCGNGLGPPVNCHNTMVEGFESRFYVLDPDSVESLRYWDIPPYAWAIREEIEAQINPSESWKVDVKFLAAIPKSFPRFQPSLLKAPTAWLESWYFAEFQQEEWEKACGSGSGQESRDSVERDDLQTS